MNFHVGTQIFTKCAYLLVVKIKDEKWIVVETGLDVIKTENLYNARRRERLFGVDLKVELGMMKDEVSASSFFMQNLSSRV